LALDAHGGAYRWVDGLDRYVRVDDEEALVEALV
jgi:hypothetical protein